MKITAIQTFLSVVRTRNLNRAAEELHITQSAVSARLDALEQALGARLLVRSRKGASLTKEGYAFLEQAEVIVRSWQNAQARISLPQGVTRLFSLVCDPGRWTAMGSEWVARVRAHHPEIAVEIWAGQGAEALSWLQSGKSDAALLGAPLAAADIVNRECTVGRLIQVSTKPRTAVQWHPDYVYVDYGPGFRSQHAEQWPSGETAAIAFSNPDWAFAHLMRHGGSAYLPESMVLDPIAQGILFRVEGAASFRQRSYLSWRKDREEKFPWLASVDLSPEPLARSNASQ